MRLIAALLLLCSTALAEDLRGKCVRIVDGDTVVVLVGTEQVRVRLAGIDAPEHGQDFATASQERLGELAHGKNVRVAVTGTDRYGRTLGVLWLAETDVQMQLVREGLAWHYRQFNDSEELANAEREAREAKLGIWSRPDAIPPWEFRRSAARKSPALGP